MKHPEDLEAVPEPLKKEPAIRHAFELASKAGLTPEELEDQERREIYIQDQGQKKPDFPERMYVYNYRIYDRYRRKVASLAVLADEIESWRPTEYSYELWGSRAGLCFPLVKLLDYRDRWSDLESSRNPFAVVAMAHLKANDTAKDRQSRFRWKLKLVRHLYDLNYERQDILELFRFIDWILGLPDNQEEEFWQELSNFEERRQMQYVTSVERIGFKKGRQEGKLEGKREGKLEGKREGKREGLQGVLKRQIRRRFGEMPAWAEERLNQATVGEMEQWTDRILDASSLEEIFY